jgi:hypothetical protein
MPFQNFRCRTKGSKFSTEDPHITATIKNLVGRVTCVWDVCTPGTLSSGGTAGLILNLSTRWSKWSASCSSCLNPSKSTYRTEEWVGPRASLDTTEKLKISCLSNELNHSSAVQPTGLLLTTPMLTQHPNINKFSDYLICFQAINDTWYYYNE